MRIAWLDHVPAPDREPTTAVREPGRDGRRSASTARAMPATPPADEVDEGREAAGGGSPDRQEPAESVPAVSVCIPLYMKERYVATTIQSVLDQTFTDFELLILHNASPDQSAEIAESFDDPRIRVFHNAETVSGPENVARLVPLARAPLVKIVAADDVLHPTLLEKQVAVLQDEGIALVSCRQNMIGEFGEVMYRDRSLRSPDLVGRQVRTTVLRRVVRHVANPLGVFVNVMFRRSAYDESGGMPDVPFIALDLALWLNIIRHGDFFGIPETLVDFRIADGSASAGSGLPGIAQMVRYITALRRANPHAVRLRDTAYGTLRTPLMMLRHQLIVSAAGPRENVSTRVAAAILGLSRRMPDF